MIAHLDTFRQTFDTTGWTPRATDGRARRRWFAIGDPQTTFEKVLTILDGHALLDARGMLREDVGLVSIGDHFDFRSDTLDVAAIGREGMYTLRWFAEHPPDQVVLVMGNHDVARVMELAFETDESFAAARVLAKAWKNEPAASTTLTLSLIHI